MLDLDYFTFQENTKLWRLSPALGSSECLSAAQGFYFGVFAHLCLEPQIAGGRCCRRRCCHCCCCTGKSESTDPVTCRQLSRNSAAKRFISWTQIIWVLLEWFLLSTARFYSQSTSRSDPRRTRRSTEFSDSRHWKFGDGCVGEITKDNNSTSTWQADATLVISSHSNFGSVLMERESAFA